MPEIELTADERALLRAVHHHIAPCVACPADGIDDLRYGLHLGGGHGFDYEFGHTRITGRWYEWIPVKWARAADWRPTGSPIVFRQGELLREVTYGGAGVGLEGLSLLFIALKLTHTIRWSWWWVLSPFWIPAALVILILVVGSAGAVVVAIWHSYRRKDADA